MNVVKMGAQFESPNQMIEMTINAVTTSVGTCSRVSQSRIAMHYRFERGLCPRNRKGGEAPLRGLRLVEEFFADAVGVVPDVRLEEAELLVDLELRDERLHLRVVEIAGDGRVAREEVVVHEVTDVHGKARRPAGGLAPEVDLLGEIDALAAQHHLVGDRLPGDDRVHVA